MSRIDLYDRASELRAQRVPFVMATVVRADAPTSAKPGDSAVVLADGTIEGFVGGSCAQATVRAESLRSLANGNSTMLIIAAGDDSPAGGDAPGVVRVSNPCLSGGTLEMFLEPALPAPLLAIYGQSPIAAALATGALALGFEARLARAEDAVHGDLKAVVVATHGFDEETIITDALSAGVDYIGLVASRRRGDAILAAMDLAPEARSRIHSPAGLDIGARNPAEIAISILAEIVLLSPKSPKSEPRLVAIDPVCEMQVAMVESSLHSEINGTTYWFCAKGCLRAFGADPQAFLVAKS